MPTSTRMVIAKRALNKDIVVDVPEWACNQLERGQDTPHLRILAGLTTADGRWEIERVCDRTLHELGITIPNQTEAVALYALELSQSYMEGSIEKEFLLQTLCQMCIDTDYSKVLYPFYVLRWTWDDLKVQGWSFYEQEATRGNFDELLSAEIEKLKENVEPSAPPQRGHV